MLAALVQGLGGRSPLSSIAQAALRSYFNRRREGRSNATINREIDNARAVLRHAEQNRFDVGELPNWKPLKPKVPRQVPRELSPDEESRLFEHLRRDVRDAVDFLLKSGWRRGEVLGLRWSDCDLPNRTAVTRIKGGDVVARPLTKALTTLIESQPKVGPFVFTYVCQKARKGRLKGERYPLTPTALRKPFAKALKDGKISSFRTHDLRHTRATRIVRETGSLVAAQAALKHRSINTTLRYAHVSDEDTGERLKRVSPEIVPKRNPRVGKSIENSTS